LLVAFYNKEGYFIIKCNKMDNGTIGACSIGVKTPIIMITK